MSTGKFDWSEAKTNCVCTLWNQQTQRNNDYFIDIRGEVLLEKHERRHRDNRERLFTLHHQKSRSMPPLPLAHSMHSSISNEILHLDYLTTCKWVVDPVTRNIAWYARMISLLMNDFCCVLTAHERLQQIQSCLRWLLLAQWTGWFLTSGRISRTDSLLWSQNN